VDERKNYFKQTMDTLKAFEQVHIFEAYIRIDSSVEWAQDNSRPVIAYRKNSRSAKEYISLAMEVDKIAGR
jgi:chromosome partitioning protein